MVWCVISWKQQFELTLLHGVSEFVLSVAIGGVLVSGRTACHELWHDIPEER